MNVLQVYGFSDKAILFTEALNARGIHCDMVVSNRQYKSQLPSWTKQYPHVTKDRIFVHRAEDARDPKTVIDLARFVNGYDTAILHHPSCIYADAFKIPYHVVDGGSSRFIFPPPNISNPPVEADKAAARRAYKNAKTVFVNDIDMLYKLFLPKNYTNTMFIPLVTDTDLFCPMNVTRDERFTIYLPTRQENEIKGTFAILDGIRQFLITQHKNRNNILIRLPLFGSDSSMIPLTLKDMHLDDITEIVPLYPKPQFAQAINQADVVIDQLLLGSYAGVSIQAMSCAKEVIVNAHRPWYQEQIGDIPPILYAKTAFDVAAQLEHAYDFYQRNYHQMGKAARAYTIKHHHYTTVVDSIIHCLEA